MGVPSELSTETKRCDFINELQLVHGGAARSVCSLPRLRGRVGEGASLPDFGEEVLRTNLCPCPLPVPPPQAAEGAL